MTTRSARRAAKRLVADIARDVVRQQRAFTIQLCDDDGSPMFELDGDDARRYCLCSTGATARA